MTAGAPGGVTSVPDSVLIEGAKLFDGDRFLPRGCLLVLEGRVAALDARLTPPAGVPVLAARGGTVLPGLIDAHVHVFPGALHSALRSGVITELDMFADPHLGPHLDPRQRATLDMDFPVGPGARTDLAHAMSAVAQPHDRGLRLLAGTDASSPGTAHGASLHDELHLLVQAGLSPTAALAAATSTPV